MDSASRYKPIELLSTIYKGLIYNQIGPELLETIPTEQAGQGPSDPEVLGLRGTRALSKRAYAYAKL